MTDDITGTASDLTGTAIYLTGIDADTSGIVSYNAGMINYMIGMMSYTGRTAANINGTFTFAQQITKKVVSQFENFPQISDVRRSIQSNSAQICVIRGK